MPVSKAKPAETKAKTKAPAVVAVDDTPGRPKKTFARHHLYLRADAFAAMRAAMKQLDAGGASETVRIALRHYANLLTVMASHGHLEARRPTGTTATVAHQPDFLLLEEGTARKRAHVHLSTTAVGHLTTCDDLAPDVDGQRPNTSAIIGAALLHLTAILTEMEKGSTVTAEWKGARLGYSIWTKVADYVAAKKLAA